jgi:hypothetical protein
MSKSMRIVLVDPLGDILFSGDSIAQGLPTTDDAEDRCPETKRSATSESGMYAAVAYAEDAGETLPENGTENSNEIRSSRPRAA